MRDGNATRSFETLMRYRSAAMAEFTRALRTLQELQARRDENELTTPPARCRKPKEPNKARKIRSLAASTALVAAMPPARGTAIGAHARPDPEPSLESLIRPALQVLRSRATLECQSNPTKHGTTA